MTSLTFSIVSTGTSIKTLPMNVHLKVTHLCINLSDDAIEALGYKKPFIGKVLIDVPVDTIEKVSDVIVMKQSLAEIKSQIERHN